MKKKIIKIKIIPKKKQINSNLKSEIKINKGGINTLFSFFTLKDQITLSQINKNFKNFFLSMNNISNNESSDFIKYLSFLMKFSEKSENYSPFLNVYLDINVINLSQYKIGSESKGAIKALISFINDRFELTENNHFYLNIFSKEDLNLNKEIILSLKNYQKLKYTLRLNRNFDIKDSIVLFKEIPFVDFVEDDRHESLDIYKLIQNHIFSNNIEAFHYKIHTTKTENLNSYFKQFPNHLFCISKEKDFELIENNIESIFKYENNSIHSSIKNSKLNLKTIKFSYANNSFKENFEGLNLDSIENIGGFNINEDEIDSVIKQFEKMTKLKKLNNIQFGEEGDSKILNNFLDKIKINIESLSLWFSRISIEKNGIEKLLKIFPNLRKFYENSDCSGIYDSSVSINNVFSCGMNKILFEKNNLKAILKLINNYLNHQKKGRKFIKFEAIYDSDFIPLLIKEAFENKENNIINSIHSINYIVGGPIVNEIKDLKKLIFFDFNFEEECIFNSLHHVNKVNLIKISDSKYLYKNFDLIKQFNPDFIFFNDELNNDAKNKFDQLKSLKYVFLKNEKYEQVKNQQFIFEIFPSNILAVGLE